MSGGVDSSVAAHLLVRQGHDVIGAFMHRGDWMGEVAPARRPGPEASESPQMEAEVPLGDRDLLFQADAEDAREVADRLHIPFHVVDVQDEFRPVVDYFVDEYTAGRTPNPCAKCNARVKFGKLFEYADNVGAEYLATGHYARVVSSENEAIPSLCRGLDPGKDQSYALFGIKRQVLRRILLPVGDYEKQHIRRIAGELGLRVANKNDSQEICFVPPGKHQEFIRARSGQNTGRSGDIVTTDGRVVGRHPGIECFTIGQRKGLKVALGEPFFVIRIEPDTRRIVIGRKSELARIELTADGCNWLVDPPIGPFHCQAKIRYNAEAAAATAEILPDGSLQVTFDEPRFGVAPGQAVVCYDGNRVLGGGWIQ